MNRIAIFLFFFLLPAVGFAEEKVYTNSNLKPEPPIYSKSTPSPGPQPQRQDLSNNQGRISIISRGHPEQREPVLQPKHEPKTNAPSDMDKTPANAFNPANPFPGSPKGTTEQLLAEFFARVTLVMLVVVGIPFLIWLICLIDVLRNEFTANNKIIWFLVVFFLPVIGCALYFFIGTDHKISPEDDEEPVLRLI